MDEFKINVKIILKEMDHREFPHQRPPLKEVCHIACGIFTFFYFYSSTIIFYFASKDVEENISSYYR